MAIGPKLMMRQSQSLVMTPQLLQAIKLLQLSAPELSAFVEGELERNPLLERADSDDGPVDPTLSAPPAADVPPREADWASDEMAHDQQTLEKDFGGDFSNTFADEPPPAAVAPSAPADSPYWNLSGGGGVPLGEDGPDIEAYVAAGTTLVQHLQDQFGCLDVGDRGRAIGLAIISAIEPTGYLGEPLADIAARLGAGIGELEAVLAEVQSLDPVGVGARTLAECLALQLRERNRLDPAMAALLDNLDALGRRDFALLKRRCGVDDEDLAEMVAELRQLDPKPGLVFGAAPAETAIADVIVRPAPDGGWSVEVNSDALPRVIANRAFYATISGAPTDRQAKLFLEEAWSSANWIVRSLEQRARTILKVGSEIVRQQDGFFAYGVAHLRPLNLKTVADILGLHESTVSRVTANKLMATPRGLFEMKYFFTTAIAASDGGEAVSAEAVRFKIRQLIEGETALSVLSDDAIVDRLRTAGIVIARRTVAKYRESMGIQSSSVRRRELAAAKPRAKAS